MPENVAKETKFDAVFMEKPIEDGLERNDINTLLDMIKDKPVFPLEIININLTSAAMGFITADAADQIDSYGQESPFGNFISSILADMDKENENGVYDFGNIKIKIVR